MSDGVPISRDEQMLARLAELDLAAAEKAHARMMAAEAAEDIALLGRTYDRMARSLRQTLGLKAKLSREAAQDARRAESLRPREYEPYVDPDQEAIDARVAELQAAGKELLVSYFGRDSHRLERLERLEAELDDWISEDDFLDVALATQVVRLCRILGLPEDHAHTWRASEARPDPDPDPTPQPAPAPRRLAYAPRRHPDSS